MDDDGRQLFIEVLEEHIRDWVEAAKVCEQNARSVELGGAARHSGKKEAERNRARIAELRELIEYLKGRRGQRAAPRKDQSCESPCLSRHSVN